MSAQVLSLELYNTIRIPLFSVLMVKKAVEKFTRTICLCEVKCS